MKRKLTLDNLITFAKLGHFGSYGHNILEVLIYTKNLEKENLYLKQKLVELETNENTIEVKVNQTEF